MTSRSLTRQQVRAHIIQAMAEAADRGEDAYSAGRRLFPSVPVEIIAEASVEVDHRRVEAWWQALEGAGLR